MADLNNVGPRGGGAITAGLFLKEFAADVPWVHLDIAGPAFTEKDLPLGPKGGTGVAVRTLLTYLTSVGASDGASRGGAANARRASHARKGADARTTSVARKPSYVRPPGRTDQ